jgi:glucan 1,3-beta-glucosidase
MVVQNGKTLAIYSDNLDVYPDTIALLRPANSLSSGWKFLGCYTDNVSARTLSNYIIVPGGQGATTIEACQAACRSFGYSLAGVEYANECCKFLFLLPTISISRIATN